MNDDANRTTSLATVAEIRSGYPFRKPVQDSPDGDVAVVQIKDVNPDTGINWAELAHTRLTGRRSPDWLQDGDILFTGRGSRNQAVVIDKLSIKAVAAPHLFVIRPTRREQALPAFIAWFINQREAQRYFSQTATGSYITSIRKQVLQELPLQLPGMEKQELIVRLDRAACKERKVLTELIENRKQQLDVVGWTLMKQI